MASTQIDEILKRRLVDMRLQLLDAMNPADMCDHLVTSGVYAENQDDYQQINNPMIVRKEKNRKLISSIQTKGPGALTNFAFALALTGQRHWAEKLVEGLSIALPGKQSGRRSLHGHGAFIHLFTQFLREDLLHVPVVYLFVYLEGTTCPVTINLAPRHAFKILIKRKKRHFSTFGLFLQTLAENRHNFVADNE